MTSIIAYALGVVTVILAVAIFAAIRLARDVAEHERNQP